MTAPVNHIDAPSFVHMCSLYPGHISRYFEDSLIKYLCSSGEAWQCVSLSLARRTAPSTSGRKSSHPQSPLHQVKIVRTSFYIRYK